MRPPSCRKWNVRFGTGVQSPLPLHAVLQWRTAIHHVTKHLQQAIETDHFRVKWAMPRVGGRRSVHTERRTIQGFEALLWLSEGFGFAGAWIVGDQC